MKLKNIIFKICACLVIVLSTMLTSCNEKANEALPTVPVLKDTRSEEVEMVTIKTLNGKDVTYNKNTKNIVALSNTGDLLALGVRPLAVDGNANQTGYEEFFKAVEILNNTQPFDPEEVMSYRPELILTYNTMDETNIAKLEKIAPTIPVYFDTYDYTKRLTYLGDILGLSENAKTIIDYCKKTEEVGIQKINELNIQDKSVTVYTYYQGLTIPPNYKDAFVFNHILYNTLNLKMLPIVKDFLDDQSQQAFSQISNEKLKDYEGDLVIFAGLGEASIPDSVKTNEGYKSLKAVKENRVGCIDMILYSFKDALYMEAQYNQILEALKVASNK